LRDDDRHEESSLCSTQNIAYPQVEVAIMHPRACESASRPSLKKRKGERKGRLRDSENASGSSLDANHHPSSSLSLSLYRTRPSCRTSPDQVSPFFLRWRPPSQRTSIVRSPVQPFDKEGNAGSSSTQPLLSPLYAHVLHLFLAPLYSSSVHILYTVSATGDPNPSTTFARSSRPVAVKPQRHLKGQEKWGKCELGEVVRSVCAMK
jgi:hypothetical protein